MSAVRTLCTIALAGGLVGNCATFAAASGEKDASESPWGWVRMPKITMPKVEMPKLPADPLAPIKSSARKVSDGTKRAWEGTKEMFTFGATKAPSQPVARTASRSEPPSLWQRMFGASEEPQPPQTVAEWMNQPRLDP